MNHYTYLLINKFTGMLYIGKRSCTCLPEEDIDYMSSSKYVPKQDCFKVILSKFESSSDAIQDEIKLHTLFNVGVNPAFYNKAKQTSTSFDTTGTTHSVSNITKERLSTSKLGIIPNWSTEGKLKILSNLSKGQLPEAREKAALRIKTSGSNKGINNAGFRPWFITTDTQTFLFTDISKSEQSVLDGHYNKYYADLQKKFNKVGPVVTKQYGLINNMGFIHTQYKI